MSSTHMKFPVYCLKNLCSFEMFSLIIRVGDIVRAATVPFFDHIGSRLTCVDNCCHQQFKGWLIPLLNKRTPIKRPRLAHMLPIDLALVCTARGRGVVKYRPFRGSYFRRPIQ
jgi:hypothetical protein